MITVQIHLSYTHKDTLSLFVVVYSTGGNDGALELRKELSLLRLKVETLEIELKTKDDDIKRLQSQKGPHEDRCKV